MIIPKPKEKVIYGDPMRDVWQKVRGPDLEALQR